MTWTDLGYIDPSNRPEPCSQCGKDRRLGDTYTMRCRHCGFTYVSWSGWYWVWEKK